MHAPRTRSSLRSRLVAGGAIADDRPLLDDPFAGEDEPWAPEDWAERLSYGAEGPERFLAGLILGIGVSAVGWLALIAAAIAIVRALG